MISCERMMELFETANSLFLSEEQGQILDDVSERSLCGLLMCSLRDIMRQSPDFRGYHVEIEYNRMKSALENKCKKLILTEGQLKAITCDLIIHSRGEKDQDNLLALEMKKFENTARYAIASARDRDRLKALTHVGYDSAWFWQGFYPTVCGYVLGVFYEICPDENQIKIEYYHRGKRIQVYRIYMDQESVRKEDA